MDIINEEFLRRKSKNENYSLRAYANFLGISPASLSHIISGKRSIPVSKIEGISQKLQLSDFQKNEMLVRTLKLSMGINLSSMNTLIKPIISTSLYNNLLIDYRYYLVLTCFMLSDFEEDITWLKSKTNLKIAKLFEILSDLENMKLIVETQTFFKINTGYHQTTDQINSETIVKSHLDNLEQSKKGLRFDVAKRDYQFITLPIDMKKIDQAKEITRKYLDKMETLLETGETTEVYRLCVQLYPLKSE